jgi:hypothetical protein
MTERDRTITISLPENDVGQILDALRVREECWRYTQRYLEGGIEELDRVIEDCQDVEEAGRIADYYVEIIAKIKRQMR